MSEIEDDLAALRNLAQYMCQYLQHLPICGLGDHILDPTAPGVAISRPVEGCTCGLAKAMPLWFDTVWNEPWPQ